MDSFFPIVSLIFCQAILNLQFILLRLKIAWQKIRLTVGKKESIELMTLPKRYLASISIHGTRR